MSQMIRTSLDALSDLLSAVGMTRPLYVCSRRWTSRLPDCAPVFSHFEPNPDFDQCAAGVSMFQRKGCDGLVAIGGGSTMDTAKGIKAMLLSTSFPAALLGQYPGSHAYPLICVPTTAGSGSEATQTAVLYVDGQKHSLSHPMLLAQAVILDPSLLSTLPADMKRSCALDALCQAIESFWSKAATTESQMIAGPAMQVIFHWFLPYLQGDRQAAEQMLHASYAAGEAIQMTRTTAAHAMSYQITKQLGIPHGDACALTLPYLWMRLTRDPAFIKPGSMLASRMGVSFNDAPLLFLGLCLDTGLYPPRCADPELLDYLTDSVNIERLGNHPQPLTREDIRALYIQALNPAPEEMAEKALALWRHHAE